MTKEVSMNAHARMYQKSIYAPGPSRKAPADLDRLKTVIARGDYDVPAAEIAKKMLSAKVFRFKKHG